MNINDIIEKLENAGTAQNRKIYSRHGVKGEQYGVSFAALKKLADKLKQQPGTALTLWKTGNHDARVLATLIADVTLTGNELLDDWSKDLDNYIIADAFSGLAKQSTDIKCLCEKWRDDRNEFIGQVGWNLIAAMAEVA